jgi:hypothetical protein
MRAILAPALLFAAGPTLADLACPMQLYCSDQECFAANPTDEEGATYVRDPLGAAPELYLGDGIWVAASRADGRGALTWTATSPTGEAVSLGLRREGGDYILTRREPAGGRVWTATGRCTDIAQ